MEFQHDLFVVVQPDGFVDEHRNTIVSEQKSQEDVDDDVVVID